MLMRRLIACLDVRGGRAVKGVQFVGLRDVGDPAELAACYEAQGADEIVFLDISASVEERSTLLDVARRTAERLFIPLTIGGGIRTAADAGAALRAGADKISVNTAAVERPEVMTECAARFGSQCVVASIDARRENGPAGPPGHQHPKGVRWRVVTHGGRTPTSLDAVAWAAECVRRGAGEILLTSVDHDGGRSGYDLELTRAVSGAVDVPVIASGGAGEASHLCDAVDAGADAVLVAGILHDGVATVTELKAALAAGGHAVRSTA